MPPHHDSALFPSSFYIRNISFTLPSLPFQDTPPHIPPLFFSCFLYISHRPTRCPELRLVMCLSFPSVLSPLLFVPSLTFSSLPLFFSSSLSSFSSVLPPRHQAFYSFQLVGTSSQLLKVQSRLTCPACPLIPLPLTPLACPLIPLPLSIVIIKRIE